MPPEIKHQTGSGLHDQANPTKPVRTLGSLFADRPASAPAAPAPAAHGAVSDDDVMDVGGVVQMLRVGRNKVYEMVARNEIPHRRFGRTIRFSRAAIMRCLDSWSSQGAKERQ